MSDERRADPAMIMYTSGTTSHPKGCVISHESLVRTGRIFGEQRFPMRHGDRMWDPLPLFHLASILPFNGCLTVGATYVGLEHFEPGAALRMLEQCTVAFAAFDLIWAAVLDHPGLRGHRPLGAAPGQRQWRARAAAAVRRAHAVADADLAVRRDRGRGSAGTEPPRRPARAPRRLRRAAVRGHGGADRRSGDRGRAPRRAAGRDHLPRPGAVRRLLQGSRADRGRDRRRRLLPHRRPGRGRRRRAAELHRAPEGHAQGRRRERRGGRDRGLPGRTPGDRRGPGRGRAGRALPGGGVRLRDAAAGRGAGTRRGDRALPREDRVVQDPALPADRRRVAHVGHEDPEVQAPRADRAELAEAGVRSAPKLSASRP